MVNSINSAVSAKANGIATMLIDPTAFTAPVKAALKAGIPVVAYNADEPQTGRLAYIGQDLLVSGQQMGLQIASLLPTVGRSRCSSRPRGRPTSSPGSMARSTP